MAEFNVREYVASKIDIAVENATPSIKKFLEGVEF